MAARERPAARKVPRPTKIPARPVRNKRESKIVLDERAQEQPTDRETAQRSGRPSK